MVLRVLPGEMSRKTEQALFVLMLLYFAGKVIFFAGKISENIFPDETTWFGIIELFARSFLPPTDSPDSYRFGLITHVPTLYFILMGKVLPLNFFPVSNLVFLRLINAMMAAATVWCGWQLTRRILVEPVARLLCIALLTNTLMFTFLAGAVSPDNLTNLLAAASLLNLTVFFQERRPDRLLLFFALLLAGCLTKQTFLPLAASLLAVLVFHESKTRLSIRRLGTNCICRGGSRTAPTTVMPGRRGRSFYTVSQYVTALKSMPINIGLTGLCLLLFIWNLFLYGDNLIHHHTLIPQPNKILQEAQSMENRVFARDNIIRLFRDGKISVFEASTMIEQIPHEGDRYGAYQLLEVAIKDLTEGVHRLSRIQYILPWTELMLAKIYGIMAHLDLEKKGREILPYQMVFIVAVIMGCRLLWRNHLAGMGGYLVFVSLFHTLVLMQSVNYKTYDGSGFIELALQGRYIFPVIIPCYILTASALTAGLPVWWQRLAGLSVAGIFVWTEFPWFISNVTPDWFFQ